MNADPVEVSAEEADAMVAEKQQALNVNSEMEQKVEDAAENNYQDMETEEIIQVQLTEQEKAEAAEQLVQMASEKSLLEKEKKDTTKMYNDRISDSQAAIDSVLKKIGEGEERQIQCWKRVNFSKELVEFWVTGQDGERHVLKTRKMEPDDRQLSLTQPVGEDSFASETDAQDAGQAGVDYDANHAAAKAETEAAMVEEPGATTERVTQATLTENSPTTF